MRINGTLINYYFHCKRQCYLHGNRLNLEDNSEQVKIGKAIHEEKAEGKENAEIAIDNIRLDKLTKEYLTEVKKSDADVEASKWQLLFYLSVLKSKGIIRKGKLEFVEKNKKDKKTLIIELTDETEKELKVYMEEITRLLNEEKPPECINKNSCLLRVLLCIRLGGERMGSTRYIMSMGELTRKDNSLCFRKNGRNVYIPVENTKEIYCCNEVSINTKLLDFLSQNNIIVHFFNYYGGYSGTFYPRDHYLSGKLIVKQAAKYQNDRLDIARAIVKGIGLNIYEVLYHYYKHDKKEVKETIDWIKKIFLKQVEQAANIKELLAYEGEVWLRFYSNFKFFLPEDFVMNKRVKRPPDNPINALISFGNTLLYTKTISAIYQTHLDQRISFLHEPSEGRFSLSLDISEVFKPVIVYRTIFDLVNNRRLQVEKHFEKKVNYCILNEEGRKIFIEAFEARMESVFMHPKLKRKVSYRTAIKLDCYKLIKNILEEKEFIPFSLKEGM